MNKPKNSKQSGKDIPSFYKMKISAEKDNSSFYAEYNILLKTIESVNNFNSLYKAKRSGAKGTSTHAQQDLYRAMLIFACAGLDVFIKKLVKTKLAKLIQVNEAAKNKFKEYVKRGMKKDDKDLLNTVALALIEQNPSDIFLKEYVNSLTGESLQSTDELWKVSDASGLDTKGIFTTDILKSLKDAFLVRNQITHEMDINVDDDKMKTPAYRTRRQRTSGQMEKHTKAILKLAESFFVAYKNKFKEFKIDTEKAKELI